MRSSESRVLAGRMGRRFLLSLALCLPVLAQTGLILRLYPIDDTARDPAFRSFVKKLRSAVRDRSTKALRKLVDDEVFVGPGDRDLGWTKFAATDRKSVV